MLLSLFVLVFVDLHCDAPSNQYPHALRIHPAISISSHIISNTFTQYQRQPYMLVSFLPPERSDQKKKRWSSVHLARTSEGSRGASPHWPQWSWGKGSGESNVLCTSEPRVAQSRSCASQDDEPRFDSGSVWASVLGCPLPSLIRGISNCSSEGSLTDGLYTETTTSQLQACYLCFFFFVDHFQEKGRKRTDERVKFSIHFIKRQYYDQNRLHK